MVINDLKKIYLAANSIRSLVNHLFQHNVLISSKLCREKDRGEAPQNNLCITKANKSQIIITDNYFTGY